MIKRKKNQTGKQGMTLIEVVLAIAITGFLLAAATSLVVSVSSIWTDRADRNFFEDHVDGACEFLRSALSSAGVAVTQTSNSTTQTNNTTPTLETPPQEDQQSIRINQTRPSQNESNNPSAGLVSTIETPIQWEKLPGASTFQDPLLAFELNTLPPLLVETQKTPATKTKLYLYFSKDEGLSLLWSSNLQEELKDQRDLKRTQISPLVKKLRYVYWDDRFEQWEEETEPKEGDGDEEYLLPPYLKLIFEHQGVTSERLITIPTPVKSALIF